jgi:prophage DNA circulation protein
MVGANFLESAFGSGGNSWEKRLKRGQYKSPSGKVIKFDCLASERKFQLRGTMFEFDGIDEGYIQRKGIGSRQYPLTCIFQGETHDLEATAFENALTERGFGTLTHPLYGEFKVIPFGEIGRNNSFVDKVNQSAVEVTFWTSTVTPYPTDQINFANEMAASIANFDVEMAQAYSRNVDLRTMARKANLKSTYKAFLRNVSSGYKSISDEISGARGEIRDVQDTVNRTIDVFIGQPLLLAKQAIALAKAPARALTGIERRLAGYQFMVRDMIASTLALPKQTLGASLNLGSRLIKIANDMHTADLFVLSNTVGAAQATLEYNFANKREALQSAESIVSMYNDTIAWRDDQFEALEAIPLGQSQLDTGEAYAAYQKVVAYATGRLVEISFSLFPERYVILDRPRALLELCAELYGRVDDSTVDALISTNKLTGDEIMEMPRGRRITYYRA